MSHAKTGDKKSALRMVAVVVLVAAAVACLSWAYASRHPSVASPRPALLWYYDFNSKSLFAAAPGDARLAALASGTDCVRAHVFSCKDCASDGEGDRWVAYLQRHSPGMAKRVALMEQMGKGPSAPPGEAPAAEAADWGPVEEQVATPSATDQWVGKGSGEGLAILGATRTACDGNPATECAPTHN